MSEDLNFVLQARREKLQQLIAEGHQPFAYSFERTHTSAEALESIGDAAEGAPVSMAGRIVALRYGTTPLSIYLPGARSLPRNQRVVSTRELDFVFLRRAHAGAWAPNEDSLW